jgi:hypothetical protein
MSIPAGEDSPPQLARTRVLLRDMGTRIAVAEAARAGRGPSSR